MLTLPNEKKLALSKLKAFEDNNFNVAKMINYVSDTVENIMEKKEKMMALRIFSFSFSISKALCAKVIKTGL